MATLQLAATVVVLPAIVLALPVLLPLLALLDANDRRQRRRAARRFACTRCGALLGVAALERADAAWDREWAERRRLHANVKWRVVRRVWAVCGRCDAGYDFEDGSFRRVNPASTSAAPEAEPPSVPPAPPG